MGAFHQGAFLVSPAQHVASVDLVDCIFLKKGARLIEIHGQIFYDHRLGEKSEIYPFEIEVDFFGHSVQNSEGSSFLCGLDVFFDRGNISQSKAHPLETTYGHCVTEIIP